MPLSIPSCPCVSAFLAAVLLLSPGTSKAATYTVTTLDDEFDSPSSGGTGLSLREAFRDANNTPENDTIILPAGTYLLTRAGITEQLAATGDLDVLRATLAGTLTIIGAGAATTVIDATGLGDRVLHTLSGANLTIADVSLTGGKIPGQSGGAIFVGGATTSFTATRCIFSDNSAEIKGGAIYTWRGATVLVTDSCFRNNSTGGDGGAVHLEGTDTMTTVARCTFDGNSASVGEGGAICIADGAVLSLTNSTLTGNMAGTRGGAVSVVSGGATNVRHCTIVANAATNSGGGIHNQATADLSDSVVTGNTAPSGPETSGAFTGASNFISGDPVLNALGYYGGHTPTMRPLPGSPLIDGSASPDPGGTDQRGFTRFVGGALDIGAVESQRFVVNTFIDEDDGVSVGGISLREAIAAAQSGDTIFFGPGLDGTTITLGGVLIIDKSLTLDASELGDGLTISGDNASRVFMIEAGVTAHVRSLNIQDGKAPDGADGANGETGTVRGFPTMTEIIDATPGDRGEDGENGGAILNHGTLTLTACTVSSCTSGKGGKGGDGGNGAIVHGVFNLSPAPGGAGGTGGHGGAISNASSGVLELSNCTLAECSAGEGGGGSLGGLWPGSGNRAVGGKAGDGGTGGAIHNDGILTMTACTVSTNAAGIPGTPTQGTIGGNGGDGGGVINANSATLRNTLLAGNTIASGGSAPDFLGTVTSSGFNLVGITDGSSGWDALGRDLLGTAGSPLDPVLGPLAENGGPTFTFALLAGSPALEHGDPSLTGTDQRGQARPSRGKVDIGAFEALPFPPEISVESPVGIDLVDGVSVVESYAALGHGASRSFTIRNGVDRETLGGIVVTIDGAHAEEFILTDPPAASTLAGGASTSFTVRFTPGVAGLRTAVIHIASDDSDESPFDIALAGRGFADAVGYDFSGADFTGADLTGLDLSGVSSGGITGVPAVVPSPWELIGGYVVGPGVNLTGADIAGLDLSGIDLSGSNLSGADFSGVDLTGADLSATFAVVTTTADELNSPSSAGVGISLREALRDAPDGMKVLFDPALSGGLVTLASGPLTVDRDLHIDAGLLADGIAVSGDHVSRVFEINSGVTAGISSLTIRDGKAPAGAEGDGGSFLSPSATGETGGHGGGILNQGTLTLTACTLDANTAGTGGRGGRGGNGDGVFIPATSGGTGGLGGDGGAIHNAASGVLELVSSTIAGCVGGTGGTGGAGGTQPGGGSVRGGDGGSGGSGGAISNNGILTITASTISFNGVGAGGTAGNGAVPGVEGAGGGALNNTHEMTLRSVLLAENNHQPGDGDVSGVVTSLGFNLVGVADGSTGWDTGNGDLLGTGASPLDPALGTLADNGGPTFTLALEQGSIAVDAGDPSLDGTDQRGQPRTVGGGVDIGAYEAPLALFSIVLSLDYNGGAPILSWTSEGLSGGIDLYRSVDLLSWDEPISVDNQNGIHIDTTAPAGKAFYLALPANSPAP